jgi:hypothetical protein
MEVNKPARAKLTEHSPLGVIVFKADGVRRPPIEDKRIPTNKYCGGKTTSDNEARVT